LRHRPLELPGCNISQLFYLSNVFLMRHPAHRMENHTTRGKPPSGVTAAWGLWRHCCCRYGWYPILLAPVITAGFLMSLYSSGGCDFLRVNVGFTPSNDGWGENEAELGLFFYQSGESETNRYRSTFVEGCRDYTDEFSDNFIDGDRTWAVARIMAYISGGCSLLATVGFQIYEILGIYVREKANAWYHLFVSDYHMVVCCLPDTLVSLLARRVVTFIDGRFPSGRV